MIGLFGDFAALINGELVIILRPCRLHDAKAVADFHTLYRANRHDRLRKIRIQLIKNRFADSRRHALHNAFNHRPGGIHLRHALFQIFRSSLRSGSIRHIQFIVHNFLLVKALD